MSLDTTGIRKNIELIDTSKTLVPTRGAVVRAEYKTNIGYKALMVLTRINNLPVPFGATVSSLTKPDNHSNFVGDAGQAWLTGLEKTRAVISEVGANSSRPVSGLLSYTELPLRFWRRNLTRAMPVILVG
ncbi:outer membrane usher protein SfmD [Salmonella enterica subsp. enterica]|nr:outer membrane usher protein SfmD [Salmonella enterica subsp. enterica]